ncbi:MAG: DinB family protein, partial [Candidatus Thorarchaeota archaeon]|nr:DinB family protein [Candidatus Thorarchaeota archaeon]
QYMLWADERIWEIVETLTDEEFSQELIPGSGSIRNRYLHMAQDHCGLYYRWVRNDPENVEVERLERDALFSFLNRCNGMIMDLIQGNGFDAAKVPSTAGEIYLTMEEMVFNIINHATYHRGQIVTILRCLGKEVSATDYMSYLINIR